MFRGILLLIVEASACLALYSQPPLSCSTVSSDPSVVPIEGVANLLADFVIKCQGGVPTPPGQPIPPTTFRITINTNVTSRLLATTPILSEALLLMDEPAPQNQLPCPTLPCSIPGSGGLTNPYDGSPGRYNVFQATEPAANAVEWTDIPFDPPGSGNVRTLRFTNLRTSDYSPPGFVCLSCFGQVVAFVSSPGLHVDQPLQTLGYEQQGLIFQTGTAIFSPTTPHDPTGPATDFTMTFTGLFPGVFKPRTIAASPDDTSVNADQNIPGKAYPSASGFYNASFTGTDEGAGLATQGTRLVARFEKVPLGVSLFVTEQPIAPLGALRAQLVNTGPDGAGPYKPAFATSNGFVQIAVNSGVAVAVWEVTSANPVAIESAQFGVAVSFSADLAHPIQTGTATVRGSLGPLSNVFIPSLTEPAPRYVENPPQPAFKVGSPGVSAVVNAADFSPNGPLAPGSIAAIFGIGLTSAGGATVRINGLLVPILGATDTQVNVQIPWELAGVSVASVTVTVSGIESDPVTLKLADIAPHIFIQGGRPLITRSSLPIGPGSTLVIYGTGFGPVQNRPATGSPALDFTSITLTPPFVTIGGVPAEITYSGLAPGYVGVWEVSVKIPDGVVIGSGVPLQLYIGEEANQVVFSP